MEFGLLGEVTAFLDGQPVDLGPARRRCVLAALAVDAGRLVPSERLAERIWGDRPPYRTATTLSSYISRLRAVLPGVVKQRSGGYLLDVDRSTVDFHRFQDLAAESTEQALAQALELWRGQALAGLNGEWAEQVRATLEQQRLTVATDLTDLRLRRGEGTRLVDELAARAEANPLDERVAAQYMLALHRSGRTAEAFEHHRGLRDALVEELGADPSQPVQDLYQRILQGDPTLLATGPVPRQLPAPPATFTGRRSELAGLDEPAGVTVITGAGGMGKTWLALTWAHEHQDKFPDGQLYVDLRGFSPEGAPMPSEVAVRGFLDALGVPGERRSGAPHSQAALLRSTLADKQALLVIDNAADSAQVLPLLPGGTSCTVLVTSRHHLPGLVTSHGARQIALGPLPETEARELFNTRLPTAKPGDVDEVIGLCGGFPLALGIIASRNHIGLVADELRALGLDALDNGEPNASLPAVLSWSHNALTDEQARAFELLAVAPGPDIALSAAAHLLDRTPAQTSALLGALERTSLVARDSGGRYGMHDLVRQYGAERARVITAHDRETALDRVIEAYIGLARYHDTLLDQFHEAPLEITPITGTATDTPGALAWFDAEHANLLACARSAGHDQVWRLTWVLCHYHWRRGHLHEDLELWRAALTAAEHLGQKALLASAHLWLSNALGRLRHFDEALAHGRLALTHAEGDLRAESLGLLSQAIGLTSTGRPEEALTYAVQALKGFQSLDMDAYEAPALDCLSRIHLGLGDHATAAALGEAALRQFRELGLRVGEGRALNTLGLISLMTGDGRVSLRYHEEALAIQRANGETYAIPYNLWMIGDALLALGRRDEALRLWREALPTIEQRGDHVNADRLRDKIRSVLPDTAP